MVFECSHDDVFKFAILKCAGKMYRLCVNGRPIHNEIKFFQIVPVLWQEPNISKFSLVFSTIIQNKAVVIICKTEIN